MGRRRVLAFLLVVTALVLFVLRSRQGEVAAGPSAAAGPLDARLFFDPGDVHAEVGQVFEVALMSDSVPVADHFQATGSFDPAVLQLVDELGVPLAGDYVFEDTRWRHVNCSVNNTYGWFQCLASVQPDDLYQGLDVFWRVHFKMISQAEETTAAFVPPSWISYRFEDWNLTLGALRVYEAEPTATPTPTATLEPTATATPEPTSSPTRRPTLTATATLVKDHRLYLPLLRALGRLVLQ